MPLWCLMELWFGYLMLLSASMGQASVLLDFNFHDAPWQYACQDVPPPLTKRGHWCIMGNVVQPGSQASRRE